MSLFVDHPDSLIRPVGDQPVIASPMMTTRLVATGSVTEQEYGLYETVLPASSPGATPHFHHGFSETFYVLDGQLDVRTGEAWNVASSGDLVRVPRRGIHAFRPAGDTDVRFLLLFTPAGNPREQYFAEMAELQQRDTPPTVDEIDAIAARHDQINLR